MSKQVARTRARWMARANKAAMAGAITATAVGVGFGGPLANAASSQTYFVGFPDWLSVAGVATLPSDAVAINNAIVGAIVGSKHDDV